MSNMSTKYENYTSLTVPDHVETSTFVFYAHDCPLALDISTLKESVGTIVGFLVLILGTIIGNFIILLVLHLDPKLQSISFKLYISLAGADFAVGAVVMPLFLLKTLYKCWPLGVIACDLHLSVDFSLTSVSFYNLCAIAAERYGAVCNPLQHRAKQSNFRMRFLILGVWVAGFISWVPIIIFVRFMSAPHPNCYLIFSATVTLVVDCMVYVLPIIIMITYYISLFSGLKNTMTLTHCSNNSGSQNTLTNSGNLPESSPQTVFPSPMGSPVKSTSSSYGDNMVENRIKEEKQRRVETELRAARMLGIIIGLFLFCWAGWIISWPLRAFYPGSVPRWFYLWAVWATYINSFINPFLYVFSNRDFRLAIGNLFARCCS